jgi:hypothetical protein
MNAAATLEMPVKGKSGCKGTQVHKCRNGNDGKVMEGILAYLQSRLTVKLMGHRSWCLHCCRWQCGHCRTASWRSASIPRSDMMPEVAAVWQRPAAMGAMQLEHVCLWCSIQ